MRLPVFFTFILGFVSLSYETQAQPIHLVPIASGLDRPVAVEVPDDGSRRIFVVEQAGFIRIVHNNTVQTSPFLDIQSRVSCCDELGLLGMAFHPNYAENGLFYVNYTNNDLNSVIAKFNVSEDANQADDSSEEILLTIAQPFRNHNGGHLAFGPDGYLYIGTGDGGGAGDPLNHGQDPLSLLGKMLRIDVDSGSPYGIPPDNPFAGTDFELDEIWATGLRNPFRYSFDRISGDLYIADVGQDLIEEINRHRAGSPAGLNFGWRLMEGSQCFNPNSNCNNGMLTLPDLEYSHNNGRCSVTGGYVYRGEFIQHLVGSYLYADFCTGEIFAATQSGTEWQQVMLLDTTLRITTFGQDSTGELYVADLGGNLLRIASPVAVAPGSGTYLNSSTIDLSVIVRGRSDISLNDISGMLNSEDISEAFHDCAVAEPLDEEGIGFTCIDVPLTVLDPGIYTVTFELTDNEGDSVTDTVLWEILATQ